MVSLREIHGERRDRIACERVRGTAEKKRQPEMIDVEGDVD